MPDSQIASAAIASEAGNTLADSSESDGETVGNDVWKSLISGSSIEDLVKESKTRLDAVVTTPAKFAGGGVVDARREFTLLASTMGVIAQYPDEIRWQSSASYAQRIFARMAANCKVGTQPVFNEAKQRQQDLETLLKGSKISGTAEEASWSDTADHGPAMQILEWALRENLMPSTSNEKKFQASKEEVLKYSELIAMFGQIIQLPGMNNADDETYVQNANAMTKAAQEVSKASRLGDADLARSSVSRIDQACNKCHESYR